MMESNCIITCNYKSIFLEVNILSFLLLILAAISFGTIEISQNSQERRNIITSVPYTYSESNVSISVFSTSVESLPRSIVVHPTVSYIGTESVQYISGRGFTIPHFVPDARMGPFFEEGTELLNITAKLGSTVTFDCRIGLLHDKTVTWLHHKDDSIHLLTVGRNVYSSDARITLSFRYPNNWRLVIVYVTRRDEGLYECQVATHPPKVKRIFLKIIAPEIFLIDEGGREVTERYYKEGSTLELTCMGIQTEFINNSIERKIIWTHGDRVLSKGISFNVSSEGYSIASTLTLSPVQKHNSGNYTCSINGLISATASIHVLNGESPAAIHLGNNADKCHKNINMFIYLLLLYITLR